MHKKLLEILLERRKMEQLENEVNKLFNYLKDVIYFGNLEHYNLTNINYNSLISNISNSNEIYTDIILERLLKYFLTSIHNLKLPTNYKLNNNFYELKLKDNDLGAEQEAGFDIAIDLIYKTLNRNHRNYSLNLCIPVIINYNIDYSIPKSKIYDVLWYMFLYIANCYFNLCVEKNI